MTPGPTAQTLALGAVGAGELDAHIRAVGAPVRATLRLVNAAGETRLEETREGMEAQIRKEKLSLSDTGNTLEMEVRAAHEVVCRQRARVDRWTEAWLAKHLQPWREAHPAQPPRPEAFPEDHPTSFLVFLSAQRRRIRPLEVAYAAARQADDREAMGEIGRRLIREAPYFPAGYFIAALDAATRGRREEALDLLEKAVERGFNNARTLAESEELRPLADDPRFRALAARASSGRGMTIPAGAEPAEVTEPSVLADEKNITIHPQLGIPVALYRFAPQAPTDEPVTRLGGKTGELLRGWYAEGTAAGNWGDLYDNRDDGHSRLSARMFPQLTHIRYGARARECELHSGLASTLVHDGTLIGNASLAVTGGAFWRSLPRAAHVNPRVMALFFVQYRSGQLYVHPAHMDFPKDQSEEKGLDPKRRDVFFANAPFPLISRGSSGSDRPHLEALAAMLAALPPDVKRALKDRHLLMPTLQMLLRRHYEGVESDEDYLSGRAHPPVFEGAGLRTERMVRAAHEMSLMTLPPWAEIRVLEEDRPRLGLDYFEAPGRTEETLTTPAAVARIFRGTDFRRRYVLSAERSGDPNGRPLTFHWRLLQGDPTRVSIRPMGERGERAEITVAWHSPMPAASEPNVMSSRVDLALFAHNGAHFSAPAFFCVYFPPCEERRYDENGRLQSVRYRRGASAPYTDPAIYTPREWTDTYEYDAEGRLAGWTRLIGPQQERYDAQGRRMSADGTAQEVAYRVVPEGQAFRLEPSP
jgi:YD repeat-containing protein